MSPSDSPLRDRFVKRVLAASAERDLSINRLADFAGVSRGYLSELLRGKKTPTLTTVERIAEALEVSACDLLCARED